MTDNKRDINQSLELYMDGIKKEDLPRNLDQRIQIGLQKASRRRHRSKGLKIGGLSFAALFICFVLLANFSASFVRVTANVPILPELVDLVKLTDDDQGLQEAIKEGYVQPVHVKDTVNGVTFEVTHLVADRSRLVLFYKITTNGKLKISEGDQVLLLNSSGIPLENGSETDFYKNEGKLSGKGKLNFNLVQDVPITDKIKLTASLPFNDEGQKTVINFNLDIPINKEMLNVKKHYPLNKWILVDGQRIFFKDVVIYPTQTVITVRFDKSNSMKILQLPDIQIKDQNGKTYTKSHLVITEKSGDWSVYLTNTHYNPPKQPELVINKIMAVDKNQSAVKVDLQTEKLASGLSEIQLKEIIETQNSYSVVFSMKQREDFNSDFIGGQIYDASGKEVETLGSSSTWDSQLVESTIRIPKERYKQPLSFEVFGYPNYLNGKIRIPLKH